VLTTGEIRVQVIYEGNSRARHLTRKLFIAWPLGHICRRLQRVRENIRGLLEVPRAAFDGGVLVRLVSSVHVGILLIRHGVSREPSLEERKVNMTQTMKKHHHDAHTYLYRFNSHDSRPSFVLSPSNEGTIPCVVWVAIVWIIWIWLEEAIDTGVLHVQRVESVDQILGGVELQSIERLPLINVP
jgi:hypothetical protein